MNAQNPKHGVQKVQNHAPLLVRYTPQKVDLETKFKPFIPDYIPAVGDIDAFIKVSIRNQNEYWGGNILNLDLESYLKVMRCEHDTETLGLTVLDEPAALQSDPTILDLQVSFCFLSSLVAFFCFFVCLFDRAGQTSCLAIGPYNP